LAAPGGGSFDRFDVTGQPIAAPVNARGQIAFFATALHAPGREGIFLADARAIAKVAAVGDAVPGGGTPTDFATDPLPALNAAGHEAFAAQIAGGRATAGIFLAGDGGLQVIEAPGVPAGVLIGFDAPALNDNDELAFVANVRRGRDTVDVLYYWNGRRLQRLVAEGELLLQVGGMLDKLGEPGLNNGGVVAFPAAILKGPVVGAIFVAGARSLRPVVRAGDRTSSGAMVLRFSERVTIDETDGIAFGAYLSGDSGPREAVLRAGAAGLSEIAVEGWAAPGGGRYARFGPWPTIAPGGVIAFIASLDGAPRQLAAFAGTTGELWPVASMGERLPGSGQIGRFVLNAIATVGPGGALTFATMAGEDGV
jgi:hypothetical protein